jgi:hypothetical protein
MAIDFQGTPVTADNLADILRRCADNLAGDYKPDSQSWGMSAASELLSHVTGPPLTDVAARTFEEFLERGTPEQVLLATSFLPPDRISASSIVAAMQRSDLDAALKQQVRAALGRVLSSQPAHFDPSFRAQVGQPGWESLVGAFLIADHPWTMAHLQQVLGASRNDAANSLWYGLQNLNTAEGQALRAEIDKLRGTLGDAYADLLIKTIDGELATGNMHNRAGNVRWPQLSLVP